jgi:putative two-component system response regulator
MIVRLAKAAEFRDKETGNHIVRVSHYCRILASNLGLNSDTCEQIFQASPLHDVGKIAIPDSLLLKPGKLDNSEWAIMKKHCQLGAELLQQELTIPLSLGSAENPAVIRPNGNPFLAMAADIALNHHEHWNGNGYPNGIAGAAIPLVARICAVADVYDTLSTSRPYKQALDEAEVLMIMRKGNGHQFDPEVFAAFEKSQLEFRQIHQHYKDAL